MATAKNYSGQRYGRLVAVERVANHGGAWRFRCDCGQVVVRDIARVRFGTTSSCGCLRAEITAERSTTHGHATDRKVSPTLSSYRMMISRCYNPTTSRWPQYGGRGITVCDRWLGSHGFENFVADMGERPPETSIDRIDNDGPYGPENCRWADKDTQASNKTNTIRVAHNGATVSLRRFARETGVKYLALYARVRRGQDPHAAAAALLAK